MLATLNGGRDKTKKTLARRLRVSAGIFGCVGEASSCFVVLHEVGVSMKSKDGRRIV